MEFPIIVSGKGDIDIFSSCEEACSYLEPVDVKNGEYVIYDADGFLLNFNIVEKQRSYFGLWKFMNLSVNIDDSVGENKSKDLLEKLLVFLDSVGINKFKRNANLQDVVSFTEHFLSRNK